MPAQQQTQSQSSTPSTSQGQETSSDSSTGQQQEQQQTSPAEGNAAAASAVVSGSAQNSEFAFDNSYTPALVAALQANPNLSLAEVLDLMGQRQLQVGGSQPQHHPTVASYGDRTANTSPDSKKMATFVANQNYQSIGNLNTPIAEANTMQGALTGRGYQSKGVQQDQTANQMVTHYAGLVGEADAGDEIVCYYGGHGAEEGLIGVQYSSQNEDIFYNSTISTCVNMATTKGAHIRFIMDSCHSGTAAQLVRDERINELTENAQTLDDTIYALCAQTGRDCKNELMEHVHQRQAALEGILTAYNDYANAVPQVDPAVTSAFRTLYQSTQTAFDTAATEKWNSMRPTLVLVQGIVSTQDAPVGAPPNAISDFRTLGAECDYCDTVAEAALDRSAEPAEDTDS